MVNVADRNRYVPDPPPGPDIMDPRASEWIVRQLRRLGDTTLIQHEEQVGGDEALIDHIADRTNPHDVRHTQLQDVAGNLTHPQIDAHVADQGVHVPPGGNANQVLAKESGADYDTGWVNQGTRSIGESIPGTGGNIEDVVNAHCFDGAFSDGSCRMCIGPTDLAYVGYDGIVYRYFGPTEVCIGSGGAGGTYPHRTTIAEDWLPTGTTSHPALSARDAADQHPTSAITNLDADQATQDGRLDALETHPPRTDNPHNVTHAQLPDNGSNDHAVIDSHIADTLIHFGDVAIDGIGYLRRDRSWIAATNLAILGGQPNNGGLGTGGLILTGWDVAVEAGLMVGAANAVTGEITIPETAWYRVVIHIYGNQGNDTKEESIWLDFEAGGSWAEIGHESVDTDKTSGRLLGAVFTRQLIVGDSVRVRLRASSGLGTFSFSACTFEVSKLV